MAVGLWGLKLGAHDSCNMTMTPTHRVAEQIIKDWNIDKGSSIQILPFGPPSSPGLSSIENVWGWVKAKVDEKGCKTFDEFQLIA